MTPEGMFPFFAAYAICASGAIFFSLFAIAVFLGLAIIDIWNSQEYLKPVKILLSIIFAFFPEIGTMSWAVYFGRSRKLIFRIIAFATSGLYLLLQVSFFFLPMQENGSNTGWRSAFVMHCMWSPFILIGGAVSFFILRAILNKNNIPAVQEVQQETI